MNQELIIYGKHSVLSMLENNPSKLIRLYISQENLILVEKFNLKDKIKIIKPQEFIHILPAVKTHQNIMALCHTSKDLEITDIDLTKTHSILICLDQVTDISNIGSILRSSAAFKADAVLIAKNNSPADLSQIYKISSGAAEIVPIIKIINFSNLFEKLKKHNYWIIGLDHQTDTLLSKFVIPPKSVIILGSEGNGIRRLVKTNCDILCKIPISSQMESLNVGHCASIVLYEYYKLYQNLI